MKTTKEQRRESLIDWRQVDFECEHFNHRLLEDIDTLELRLTQAMGLLEQCKAAIEHSFARGDFTPGGSQEGLFKEIVSDLERFVKDGKE